MKRNRLNFWDRLETRAQNHDELVAGWHGGASFVQLEPKARNTVSPEVQAMVDKIHRNAVMRELSLRAEFDRKLGHVRTASGA